MAGDDSRPPAPGGLAGIGRLADLCALAGGALALATALLVAVSVGRRWLTGEGIPGDFELVQIATAVTVFAVLPLCQWRGGHVVVDAFSGGWPNAVRDGFDSAWDVLYAAVMAVIAWQLARGAAEAAGNGTVTMVLGLPIGWAIGLSAALAAIIALVALATAWRRSARP